MSVTYDVLDAMKKWCGENVNIIEVVSAAVRRGWDEGGAATDPFGDACAEGGLFRDGSRPRDTVVAAALRHQEQVRVSTELLRAQVREERTAKVGGQEVSQEEELVELSNGWWKSSVSDGECAWPRCDVAAGSSLALCDEHLSKLYGGEQPQDPRVPPPTGEDEPVEVPDRSTPETDQDAESSSENVLSGGRFILYKKLAALGQMQGLNPVAKKLLVRESLHLLENVPIKDLLSLAVFLQDASSVRVRLKDMIESDESDRAILLHTIVCLASNTAEIEELDNGWWPKAWYPEEAIETEFFRLLSENSLLPFHKLELAMAAKFPEARDFRPGSWKKLRNRFCKEGRMKQVARLVYALPSKKR